MTSNADAETPDSPAPPADGEEEQALADDDAAPDRELAAQRAEQAERSATWGLPAGIAALLALSQLFVLWFWLRRRKRAEERGRPAS